MKYATLLQKALEPEEVRWWIKFLSGYPIDAVDYAFESWARNNQFFPKPADVKALCDAYRLSGDFASPDLPVGCERCEWTGWYTVNWRSIVERAVAPCPCRVDASLRTKCTKEWATLEEKRAMYTAIKKLCEAKDMNKAIEKPKQISGIIPTTRELAQQLAKGKRWESND